jgi:hypothetical protein
MTAEPAPEQLEHELVRDLGDLRDDLREDEFGRELYRGLASHRLSRLGDTSGSVSLSWRRAEEVVNGLRERAGEEPLTLAQTGGEGELSDRVAAALSDRGWRVAPRDTSTHHRGHVSEPASPPPKGQGERDAPNEPPEAWRRAHEEAERP